jgi:molybdopterin adenylyltransferase
MRAAVVTVSDSCFEGRREDLSGPALSRLLEGNRWTVVRALTIPDELSSIRRTLESVLNEGPIELLVTTGGTGIAARDVTPEAIRPLLEKEIPGFGELMRHRGMEQKQTAVLSRSFAGTIGRTLVLCLPGSLPGALQSLTAVLPLIPHAVNLLAGRTAHDE